MRQNRQLSDVCTANLASMDGAKTKPSRPGAERAGSSVKTGRTRAYALRPELIRSKPRIRAGRWRAVTAYVLSIPALIGADCAHEKTADAWPSKIPAVRLSGISVSTQAGTDLRGATPRFCNRDSVLGR